MQTPPLDEATFGIKAYDNSSKKPIMIATIMVTTGVITIEIKVQVVESKLSYNLLLGRPWLHDMDAVPSTVHGRLKFEYQGEVHTILGDLESYAFCNAINFKEFTMNFPQYEIKPLE